MVANGRSFMEIEWRFRAEGRGTGCASIVTNPEPPNVVSWKWRSVMEMRLPSSHRRRVACIPRPTWLPAVLVHDYRIEDMTDLFRELLGCEWLLQEQEPRLEQHRRQTGCFAGITGDEERLQARP